jgi:hypothetical protein
LIKISRKEGFPIPKWVDEGIDFLTLASLGFGGRKDPLIGRSDLVPTHPAERIISAALSRSASRNQTIFAAGLPPTLARWKS